MATTRGTNFDQVLVSDLISKVKGKSTIAALSAQTPIPFNGIKEFTFNMDREIDIVAEGGAKSEGGISLEPTTIVPIKFEYGARISDEFMFASEEARLNILEAFNDGFAKKVAKGLDLAAFHGVNPRTGTASTVIGTNNFDSKVTTYFTYNAESTTDTPDTRLEMAIAEVSNADGDVNGIAMSKSFGADMAAMKANGVRLYPEFAFGASPATLGGIPLSVNSTVNGSATSGADHAIVGDFQNAFKWGYSKEIPLEIIQYGDPDNTNQDLKGHNQIYIRAEIYLGWGILLPSSFAIIRAPGTAATTASTTTASSASTTSTSAAASN